jgi:FKBP-type peptidyl-prolyl cis-trans isomerase FklB
MKKITFAAIAAVAAIMISSCGNGTPKANLRSDIDTMSYAIGMAQTQGLKEYLVNNLDVDTTYMAEFIKGLNEGANAGDNKKKAAYFAGIQIGQQIANRMMKGINYQVFGDDSTKTISMKNFMAGFVSGTTGKKGLMTVDSAQVVAERLMREIKAKQMEKTYGPNKEAGEKFLAENAKKEGVKTLPSGVQYKVVKEGHGAIPTDTSVVKVNYEGRLIDGTVFDASSRHGSEPAEFTPQQVIKGWTEALTMMPVGSKWRLFIPSDLAYGDRDSGQIKPFSTLIFDVELVEIVKK